MPPKLTDSDKMDILNHLDSTRGAYFLDVDGALTVNAKKAVFCALDIAFERGLSAQLTAEYRAEAKRIADAIPNQAKGYIAAAATKAKVEAATPRCPHGSPVSDRCAECEELTAQSPMKD